MARSSAPQLSIRVRQRSQGGGAAEKKRARTSANATAREESSAGSSESEWSGSSSGGSDDGERVPKLSLRLPRVDGAPRAPAPPTVRRDGEHSRNALSSLFQCGDFSSLSLKEDHTVRPIWVCPDLRIFLEAFSPLYQQAYDFLVAVSDPVSRPEHVHEYQLSAYSLFSAVSIGLETETITSVLEKLSKNHVPPEVAEYIRACTSSYGKVKIVLRRSKYFIESSQRNLLERILQERDVQVALVRDSPGAGADGIIEVAAESDEAAARRAADAAGVTEEDTAAAAAARDGPRSVFCFEINAEHVEHVKHRCIAIDVPTLEEYDFRNDSRLPGLPIDLQPKTRLRPYQEKSLSKMFSNGRARSGTVVLPCGAGKTLVGITAVSTVRKPSLILTISAVSVEQWRNQLRMWTTIDDRRICRFTSDRKEYPRDPTEASVIISTYSMVSHARGRSKESQRMMEYLASTEWGLCVLDEVHVVPAKVFRRVIAVTKAHCRMGLTATMVREDDLIDDLNFLIGPKLYEANWLDLQRDGFLARVSCAEVWCDMTPEFYREYLTSPHAKQKLLWIMNPSKFQACEFLIRFHEARGDKVIVFSDNVFALELYAKRLKRPYIYGPTPQQERLRWLHQFQHNPMLNCIFISKVGDTAIDLPEANVIIQISSHFGSRRQEAQRLGRILRPKQQSTDAFNAFFYSLVSRDTDEMMYSSKRQQFLIDQGYSFKVINNLTEHCKDRGLAYESKDEQLQLLAQVVAADDKLAADEGTEDFDVLANADVTVVRHTGKSLGKRSGADGSVYVEYDASQRRTISRHPLFQQRYKR